MKRLLSVLLLLIFTVTLIGCEQNNLPPDLEGQTLNASELAVINLEQKRSFDFFWETTNHEEGSPGYGMSRDRYPGNPTIASIASVGFALSAYVIGVDEGYITYDEGFERVDKTLDTLLTLERIEGFYYHFVNMKTGLREWNSEISIIDTAILLMGGISAGEYFGGSIMSKVQSIYDEVNWPWYLNTTNNLFYMGYSPERGFSGAWDHISEQLMLYILASGSGTYSQSSNPYDVVMNIEKTNYKGKYISTKNPELSVETPFYYSFNGSLFQHQFTHGFVDFRNINDPSGINWFDNAKLATKANYAYVQDNKDIYKTYSEFSWGLSASDGPGEYNAYGARPAKSNSHNGTIAPYAAIASINYLPKLVGQTAVHYYDQVEGLWGKYGFYDAYNLGLHDPQKNPNLSSKTPWISKDVIGIDKGITLIMISNYKSNIIWEQVMKNDNIKAGLTILGFEKKQ